LTGLGLDIRYALRSLSKTPGLFAIALLTIAVGVGVNTAMFSVLHSVLLRPLPYPEPERIVSLWPEKRWSLNMLNDVRERVTSYEATAAMGGERFTLLGDGPAETVPVGIVSATFFDVLQVRPQLGSGFEPGDAQGARGPVVLLSHEFWQQHYGGEASAVGATLRLAGLGQEQRTIVGVLPPGLAHGTTYQVWVPLVETPGEAGYWGPYGLAVMGRLRPDVSVARASQELRGLVDEFTTMHPSQFRPVRHSPVDVVAAHEASVRSVRPQLLVMMGAVGFILLIACTNVANLLLARAHSRQGEIALQMALGATRGRIVRQVLTESAVLGVIGGSLGVATAFHALPIIAGFASDHLPRSGEIGMDGTVLGFALAVSLAAGLVFGAAPALRAADAAPGELIRAGGGRGQSQGRAGGRLNNALVTAEIALCLVLLAGAGLMTKSMWHLTRLDPGFETRNVLSLQYTLPPVRYDSMAASQALRLQIEERLAALPGVTGVTSSNSLPLAGGWSGIPYLVEGREPADGTSEVVVARIVTPNYFAVMGVPVVAGRTFGPDDSSAADGEAALVVNQAFARHHWPDGDALGGRILYSDGDPMGTIIGVVRDARTTILADGAVPEVFGSAVQFGWDNSGFLLVRGAAATPTRDAVVRALHQVEPELATRSARSMDDVVQAAAGNTRFFTRLFMGFAALALLLGLIGVYGVMSYAVSRRTRELGVRLALGASPRTVVAGVIRQAMGPVALGIVIGLAGSLALTRLISGLVYGVSVADPWVLSGVGLLLALAGAGVALVPAARAARVSPLRAMQTE
jgi:putative ABC transport system permease protein